MTALSEFQSGIVKAALTELRKDPIPIHTFAFYHDHESGTVSVCVDTKESSMELVRSSNRWAMGHFAGHIQSGSWEDACLFQAKVQSGEACPLETLRESILLGQTWIAI